MPSSTILNAVAAARDALTQAQIDARKAAAQLRADQRIARWEAAETTLADLDTDIAADTTGYSTATTGIATAQAQATAKSSNATSLETGVANLRTQIAALPGAATTADVEERDEVNALLTEFGIAIP